MKKPLIFLSTCEFSGDMHGETLIKEIRKKIPDAEFFGIGGPKMAGAGMELLADPTSRSTLGFIEALRNVRKMKRLLGEVTRAWEMRRPDLVIWLDSAGFNLPLALEAQKKGISVVCMFSPSAWAYWRSRGVKLAHRVNLLLAVFPYEAEFYRKVGAKVQYVGNPVLDWVKPDIDPDEIRRLLAVGDREKLVVLMPGSRRQEITTLLPEMMAAAEVLDAEQTIKWVMPVAASIDQSWLKGFLKNYSVTVRLETGGAYNLLAAADGAIIASGTATLEAAILNTPMVVIYRIAKVSRFIYMLLLSEEQKGRPVFTGLPNLIAYHRYQRPIVPEFVYEEPSPSKIADALRRILNDPVYNAALRKDLENVKDIVGPPGVMERAAAEIVKML